MLKQLLDDARRQPAPIVVLAAAGIIGGLAVARARSGESRLPALAESVQRHLGELGSRAADLIDEGTEAAEEGIESVRRHASSVDPGARVAEAREAVASTSLGERVAVTFATTLLASAVAGYLRWRDELHGSERAPSRTRVVSGHRVVESDQPLEEHTVAELRRMAAEHDIEGRSSMNKDELVEALGDEATRT